MRPYAEHCGELTNGSAVAPCAERIAAMRRMHNHEIVNCACGATWRRMPGEPRG